MVQQGLKLFLRNTGKIVSECVKDYLIKEKGAYESELGNSVLERVRKIREEPKMEEEEMERCIRYIIFVMANLEKKEASLFEQLYMELPYLSLNAQNYFAEIIGGKYLKAKKANPEFDSKLLIIMKTAKSIPDKLLIILVEFFVRTQNEQSIDAFFT